MDKAAKISCTRNRPKRPFSNEICKESWRKHPVADSQKLGPFSHGPADKPKMPKTTRRYVPKEIYLHQAKNNQKGNRSRLSYFCVFPFFRNPCGISGLPRVPVGFRDCPGSLALLLLCFSIFWSVPFRISGLPKVRVAFRVSPLNKE